MWCEKSCEVTGGKLAVTSINGNARPRRSALEFPRQRAACLRSAVCHISGRHVQHAVIGIDVCTQRHRRVRPITPANATRRIDVKLHLLSPATPRKHHCARSSPHSCRFCELNLGRRRLMISTDRAQWITSAQAFSWRRTQRGTPSLMSFTRRECHNKHSWKPARCAKRKPDDWSLRMPAYGTSCYGNGDEQAASPRAAFFWVTWSISTAGHEVYYVPKSGKSETPSNTWFPGPIQVNPNGILIGSSVFAGLTNVSDRQTDRPRNICNTRPRLALMPSALRCGIVITND